MEYRNTSNRTDSVETLYNNGTPLTTAIASDNLQAWYKLDNTELFSKQFDEWLISSNTKPAVEYDKSYQFITNGAGKLAHSSVIGRSGETSFYIFLGL